MRIASILIFFSALLFACSPGKKVQKVEPAITKVDTSVTVVPKEAVVDSAKNINDVYHKVVKNKINFTTFIAKARVEYKGKDGGDEVTAYIRMMKDSAIWLSLRGPLGIEGFRMLITKDSVKLMDPLKKNIQYRTIAYLQELTDLPFDFVTFQDFVVGNPIFVDSNIISQKLDSNHHLLVVMGGNVFRHIVTIDTTTSRILHSKLDDIDVKKNRTCDISFSDYENTKGVAFSKKREIAVAEQSRLEINLDFKQYSINEAVTFPFRIPKNYKKL